MDLPSAVKDLLKHLRLAGYSAATLKVYADHMKRFATWLDARLAADLRRVSGAHLEAYVQHVAAESIGAGCRRLRIRAVKRLFGHLAGRGRLFLNPAEHLAEPPRPKRLPAVVVGVEQLKFLLAAPDVASPLGLRDRALLEVLYATGLRVGELERVVLPDVHLAEQLLTVRHGKGDRQRVVPLGRQAAYWLALYLREARPHLTRRRPAERSLFVVRSGRPLGQTQVREIVRKYCRSLDLPVPVHLSPHGLRHACATHLLRAGADIRGIQSLLGHRRLDSTAIYTAVAAVDVKATHQRYHPKEIGRAAE